MIDPFRLKLNIFLTLQRPHTETICLATHKNATTFPAHSKAKKNIAACEIRTHASTIPTPTPAKTVVIQAVFYLYLQVLLT